MQVKDLGEFGLIERLNAMVIGQRQGPDNGVDYGFRLLVDTGDDTAAWSAFRATELCTTDTVVEGVHFTRQTTPWADLGWKSMASNISDIAAMGGRPLYALVTLGLPPETAVADIDSLYQGMLEISQHYGVAIVGGDVVRSPVVFVTVALTGARAGQPLLRTMARPGDRVGVTGYLGASGGGLQLLLEGLTLPKPADAYLRQAHRRPRPAVDAGQLLSRAGVAAAMDISDGLADDLAKLCRASGVAARVYTDQAPMHPHLKAAFPADCLNLALNGGEDYILLFTAPAPMMDSLIPALPQGAAVIGEITAGPPGQVVLIYPDGAERVHAPAGWDHFG